MEPSTLLQRKEGAAVAKNNPVHVFLHVATMGDFWRETAQGMIERIDGSGLYDAATSLTLRVIGNGSDRYLSHRGMPKWDTVTGGSIGEFEYPTLRLVWERAKAFPSSKILYVHSKGVSSPPAGNGAYEGRDWREKWRRMMAYHTINRWRDCVNLLDNFDTVGPVYLTSDPKGHHYAGNFWWARADWLARLDEPKADHTGRLFAEFWLMSKPGFRAHDLYPPGLGDLHDQFLVDGYRVASNIAAR